MKNDVNKKKDHKYFALCIGLGLTLGMIFDQLVIGLCVGCAIVFFLDSRKDK